MRHVVVVENAHYSLKNLDPLLGSDRPLFVERFPVELQIGAAWLVVVVGNFRVSTHTFRPLPGP